MGTIHDALRRDLDQLLHTTASRTAVRARWVVFRDGSVVAAFDDEDAAYVAAVQQFGVHGGFVVAPVAADTCEPTPVSAALM